MSVEEYLSVEGAFVEVLTHSGFMNDGNAYAILGAVRRTLTQREALASVEVGVDPEFKVQWEKCRIERDRARALADRLNPALAEAERKLASAGRDALLEFKASVDYDDWPISSQHLREYTDRRYPAPHAAVPSVTDAMADAGYRAIVGLDIGEVPLRSAIRIAIEAALAQEGGR